MTALFLIGCVMGMLGISIYSHIIEAKWDKENPQSDYVDGRQS